MDDRIFGRLTPRALTYAVPRALASTDTDWRALRGLPEMLVRHNTLTSERERLEAESRRLYAGEIGDIDIEATAEATRAAIADGKGRIKTGEAHQFKQGISIYEGTTRTVPLHAGGLQASKQEREQIRKRLAQITTEISALNQDIRAARFAAQDDVREVVKQKYADALQRRAAVFEQLLQVDAEVAVLDERYSDVVGPFALGRALETLMPPATSAA